MKLTKIATLGAAALALFAATAKAEDWPAQPIHVIVPYSAGGGTDTTIRTLVPKASEALGQTIVVENKPGGATIPVQMTWNLYDATIGHDQWRNAITVGP